MNVVDIQMVVYIPEMMMLILSYWFHQGIQICVEFFLELVLFFHPPHVGTKGSQFGRKFVQFNVGCISQNAEWIMCIYLHLPP